MFGPGEGNTSLQKSLGSHVILEDRKESTITGCAAVLNSEDYCDYTVPDDEHMDDERFQVKTKTSKQSPISKASATMNTSKNFTGMPRTQSSLKNPMNESVNSSILPPNSFINVMQMKQS